MILRETKTPAARVRLIRLPHSYMVERQSYQPGWKYGWQTEPTNWRDEECFYTANQKDAHSAYERMSKEVQNDG